MGRVPGQNSCQEEGRVMAKLWAIVLIIASFLLVAPVLESGTSSSTQYFQAIGTAEGGSG